MPDSSRDYILDLSTAKPADEAEPARKPRPWLSVWFNCCRTYNRVYLTPGRSSHLASCPRCGRTMRFVEGPGGTDDQTFVVG